MKASEARKAIIAALGGITSVIPQVLASLGGIIPTGVASWPTVIAAVATAVLVYMVPNAPADPLVKVRSSLDALAPVWDVIRQNVRDEVAARVQANRAPPPVPIQTGAGGAGGSGSWPPPNSGGTTPPTDPFTVPPIRR